MGQSKQPATALEVMMMLLYIARYTEVDHAVDAAKMITQQPGWAQFGGDELAVLDLPEMGGGLYWLCDLKDVPEGRQFAVALVKAGEQVNIEPL